MYKQPITHTNRTAFVIAVDCSASMGGSTQINSLVLSRDKAVALIGNLLIDELIERATRNHKVRDYYDIAVIGYGNSSVRSLLPEVLGDGFVSVEYLAKFMPPYTTIFLDQIRPDNVVTNAPFTIHPWLTPIAKGNTPMYEALFSVRELVAEWCSRPENRHSFPPIIFNITDGGANDADSEAITSLAHSITDIATSDGNVLLINIHLSTQCEFTRSLLFPSNSSFSTEDRYCRMLFEMSSTLPQCMERLICDMIHPDGDGPFRGMAYNASPCDLLTILNIGTESVHRL